MMQRMKQQNERIQMLIFTHIFTSKQIISQWYGGLCKGMVFFTILILRLRYAHFHNSRDGFHFQRFRLIELFLGEL